MTCVVVYGLVWNVSTFCVCSAFSEEDGGVNLFYVGEMYRKCRRKRRCEIPKLNLSTKSLSVMYCPLTLGLNINTCNFSMVLQSLPN